MGCQQPHLVLFSSAMRTPTGNTFPTISQGTPTAGGSEATDDFNGKMGDHLQTYAVSYTIFHQPILESDWLPCLDPFPMKVVMFHSYMCLCWWPLLNSIGQHEYFDQQVLTLAINQWFPHIPPFLMTYQHRPRFIQNLISHLQLCFDHNHQPTTLRIPDPLPPENTKRLLQRCDDGFLIIFIQLLSPKLKEMNDKRKWKRSKKECPSHNSSVCYFLFTLQVL